MANQRSFLNAIKWAYAANWIEKAFTGLFSFILAAILGPRDFGIIAIALIYIGFIQMFLEQGLATALIQRKDLTSDHLDAVFWMDIVTSIILVGVSIIFCRLWAAVNHLPELIPVISILSLCLPIQGLGIVQIALFKRAMDFKALSICSNVSVIISGAVGIGMAYAHCGVWALVGQQITKDLTLLLLLWHQSEWRPRLKFSWTHLIDLLKLSSMNFMAQLGIFADVQAGNILLGLMFGPVAVGIYRLADRMMNTIMTLTQAGFQAVSLSEFSRQQDNPEQLRKSVLTCIKMSSIVTLPAFAGLAVVSDSLIGLIGPTWAPASSVLKVLCVWGMVIIFAFFTGPLLQALSRSRDAAVLEWARMAAGIVLLLVVSMLVKDKGEDWQVMSVAVARLATGGFLITPVFLYILMRLSKISLYDVISSIAPSVLGAVAVVGSVLLLLKSNLLMGRMLPISLAAQVMLGAISGGSVLFFIDAQLRTSIVSLLRYYWKRGVSKQVL